MSCKNCSIWSFKNKYYAAEVEINKIYCFLLRASKDDTYINFVNNLLSFITYKTYIFLLFMNKIDIQLT